MDATEMTQDFDSSFKNGKPREAKVMKEITIMEKTFETLNNGDKGSGGVSNQECLLNLTDLNGILEKNDIKQQNGILKAPGVEIAGEHETFHNRGSCSEDHTADKACILQERRLGVLNVAEKTFGKTKVKGCITQAGFSGHLLDSWEKSVCSSPPVASDAKCNQEEVFSVRSISLNGQVADKAAKTTCCSDHLSGNEQREKQLVFTVEDIVKKVSEKESIASEEDFSCSTLDSGGLSESCPSNVNSIKSNVTPYVVLKDINQKRKEKHEYCLIHPNLKQLLQKTQNKRKVGILKKLKVSLYDLLDKSCIKKRRKPPQIQNAEGQLENEKVNKLESGLEFNSSTKVLHSGESVPGETNNGHDIKTERRANSLDISTLCDEGIFARFSFMESYRENSIIHFNEKEIEKRKESLDSVMISETQKLKTTFLEPTEMFMKYECGNKFVKKAEREGSCHKIEEYQDLETLSSRISGGTSTDNTTQKLIANSHTEILQADKIYPSCSSETLSSETKFSKISRNMGAASTLPDTTGNDRDMCQANCEFDSVFVSSLSGDNLKLDLNDAIPSITRNEMFIEKRIVPYSINAFPEEVLREQVDVEKQETINQSNTMSRNKNVDSCWFLLEIEEVINEDVSVCGTDEEKKFKELEYGEVLLNHGICFPQSESKSGCQPFSNDIAVIKPSEIEKRTMAGDHQEVFDGETSNAEESVSPQPAKEKSPVWEEESLQPHQSHGVQIVLYELSGSTVKLLGTLNDNHEMFSLGKLKELEDSSDDKSLQFPQHKKSHGSCASLPSNSKNEGKLYSATMVQHRSLNLDDSRTKKRVRRPNKTPAPVLSSHLSQEQSRSKVVDALREALQKRLDDSPDLRVQKNTVSKIAKKVEKEIFKLFCCVEQNYRNKYRSLLFNLKSTENQHLFRQLILGEITPKRLVQMSSLEMAPKELAEWRAKENKRVLEIIEKEEREAPRCCSAKFTHKGIVEIQREAEEDLMFQETFGSQSPKEENSSSEVPTVSMRDPEDDHWNHTEDSNYLSCFGQFTAGSERGFKPPTYKRFLQKKANATKHLHPTSVCSEEGGRPLQEDSVISPDIPKKHRRVEKQSRNSAIWKGVIQMFSMKQFVAKAYPVSGSNCNLTQGLPHLLRSRGCILPEDVWAYLDSIWPASSKETGVIRFHPSLSKGSNPYDMLYSYLNNKQRYGIVDSNQMEIFMVPLAAYQPVPSKLHPLGGPGLDPCHPSLLLGLILPKRTCTGSLETRSNPLPKTKGKSITFKDSIETRCFSPSSCSQVDPRLTRSPRQLPIDRLICGKEGPSLPSPEPLAVNTVFVLNEELDGETCHSDPSSLLHKANQFPFGDILQTLSDSLLTGEQLDSLTLETLGVQPHQHGDPVQFCTDSDPSHIWKTLELLLPSEPACPDRHEVDGAQGANIFEAPFLQLCTEAVPSCEMSQVLSLLQIPCTRSVAGEPNSLFEETLSLIQHVQSHLQTQGPNA